MVGYTNADGGSGSGSSDCTAKAEDVLEGKIAITSDSNDDPVSGIMKNNGAISSEINCGESYTIPKGYHSGAGRVTGKSLASQTEGNATAEQILIGYEAWVNGAKHKGNMPNNGTKNASLNCGAAYLIPRGFHDGKGKVTANSLASQTGGATAQDNKVVAGHTYWKDGVLRTGNLAINSVVSFSVAAYSVNQVTATWQWPWVGPYSGIVIQYKEGGFPISIWDGVRGYTGTGNNINLGGWSSVIIGGLIPGHTYYFRAWVYCSTSDGDMVSSGYRDAICAATANGQQTLTSSGIWTVPAAVRYISIFLVGGGAGGSSGDGKETPTVSGHGGGGGYTAVYSFAVTPGQQFAYTIGGGGAGGAGESPSGSRPTMNPGGAGGNTTFGNYSANGAKINNYKYGGGQGGSGGGGGQRGWDSGFWAGSGGSDGGNGGSSVGGSSTSSGGAGQGTTTKSFGDANGTPYGPGGGGGSNRSGGNPGAGGHWGGGAGGRENGTNGTPNSGGGGGGGGLSMYSRSYWGGAGGSGVILVRW